MDALILADGDRPTRDELDTTWPGWDSAVGLVVAADGGARLAGPLGVAIDRWVGDGDSLPETEIAALEAAGIPLERTRRDKDESDTELAVAAALRLGADGIVVIGALGGPRIDHALANIGLLAMPALAGRRAILLDGRSRVSLIRAPDVDGAAVSCPLAGRTGDTVSLLPMGPGVEGVTTRGLRYPLADEPLPPGRARGLSNVRTSSTAEVVLRRGLLLVVESPATL
jgi:thiamine pyrophosphokinase